MSKKNREFTIPSMAYTIGELHKLYNLKTLVHCGSYEIAKQLQSKMDSTLKVICQDSDDRIGSLNIWMEKLDCIFLSVAMEQGLNLKGPEHPLNIIAKVNFPYLGDDWVKQRNSLDKWYWYNKISEINVVQACGRTTRSPDDYSEIYILDSDFNGLYSRNKIMFPNWFKESLVM
jgi:Rad3-related DNA helicase